MKLAAVAVALAATWTPAVVAKGIRGVGTHDSEVKEERKLALKEIMSEYDEAKGEIGLQTNPPSPVLDEGILPQAEAYFIDELIALLQGDIDIFQFLLLQLGTEFLEVTDPEGLEVPLPEIFGGGNE